MKFWLARVLSGDDDEDDDDTDTDTNTNDLRADLGVCFWLGC